MLGIEIFYGITTTTLVVLSSATLVVFNHLIDSIKFTAKSCEASITELVDKERASETGVLEISEANSEKLSSEYKNISTDVRWAYSALFLVIFLSAISILVTLVGGAFDLPISIKWILFINLLSIIIYIIAFVGLFLNVRLKKKSLGTITAESEMFIKSIDNINSLYQRLNEMKITEKAKKDE